MYVMGKNSFCTNVGVLTKKDNEKKWYVIKEIEKILQCVIINCRVLIIPVKLIISRFSWINHDFPYVNKVKNVENQTLWYVEVAQDENQTLWYVEVAQDENANMIWERMQYSYQTLWYVEVA